jgi:hypothetical protein
MIGKLLPKANFAPIAIFQLRERLHVCDCSGVADYTDSSRR